jgi:hypothetical protein
MPEITTGHRFSQDQNRSMTRELSCFISPHGFGHATRTISVLEALGELLPDLQVRIFSTVPDTLFQSCPVPIIYHRVVTDIGLVQDSAFSIDIEQTLSRLEEFFPLANESIARCADSCRRSSLIISDISPLGIEVGKQAGIPSLLLENFTWDWIYQPLAERVAAFRPIIDQLSEYYARADWRVQTEPVCRPLDADLTCPPLARPCRLTRQEGAALLGGNGRRTVLISMGGLSCAPPFLTRLHDHPDTFFVIAGQLPGGADGENVRFLPPHTPLHHPDLINGADLLICKCGYSTIAECAQTTTPLCCVTRTDFAESPVLADYVATQLGGTILDDHRFFSGDWLTDLPDLFTKPRSSPRETGNRRLAEWILPLLS